MELAVSGGHWRESFATSAMIGILTLRRSQMMCTTKRRSISRALLSISFALRVVFIISDLQEKVIDFHLHLDAVTDLDFELTWTDRRLLKTRSPGGYIWGAFKWKRMFGPPAEK